MFNRLNRHLWKIAKLSFPSAFAALIFVSCVNAHAQTTATDDLITDLVPLVNICPSLGNLYADFSALEASEPAPEAWSAFALKLLPVMPNCLVSAEYFALLGAAQLKARENSKAIEALERSLLLDPGAGGARVDYAQALYNSGQLFPAIELNTSLLARESLPLGLRDDLEKRGAKWEANTRQKSLFFNLAGGYGNNLNGAPGVGEVMLTLSGESVLLPLSNEFQSTSGPYASLQLGGQYSRLGPQSQHRWVGEVRHRRSQDNRSDILQVYSNYSFAKLRRDQRWRVDSGLTHVFFGGDALYSAASANGRYQLGGGDTCSPAGLLAGQRQHFSQQSLLDAFESKLALSVLCEVGAGAGGVKSGLGIEMGLIQNQALRSGRPGGNRGGWQLSAQWQHPRYLVQAARTRLDDSSTYSPILANGASRWVVRDQLTVQYSRPLQLGALPANLKINFFHRAQDSNIKLFSTRETSIEFGLAFVF